MAVVIGDFDTKGCCLKQHSGGDGGIRTLDRALQPYNGLANRRLQPLGHVSVHAERRILDAVPDVRAHMPEPWRHGKTAARGVPLRACQLFKGDARTARLRRLDT